LFFSRPGTYSIRIKQVDKRGSIKSNIAMTVYEQPVYGGVSYSTESSAALDLDLVAV
jgi:hypothetical protein